MSGRTTRTLVVGAGQAGLAVSRHLSRAGHPHVVLERGRIGERWRSERWESLTLLTPNWLNALPHSSPHAEPDGFLGGAEFVAYLKRYAGASAAASLHEGVSVLEITRRCQGFAVVTDAGAWQAGNVVIATGYADEPRIPALAGAVPDGLLQLHSSRYRSPGALPAGAVLVVGAGPSGQQIAAELARAGRRVVLAAGRHARMPRRYRGKDIWHWLQRIGSLDQTLADVPHERDASNSPSLALSGANGGEHLDLATLGALGVVVTGRVRGFSGRHVLLADDLRESVAASERRMRRLLEKIDRHLSSQEVSVRDVPPVISVDTAPRTLDLDAAGVSTVIWATGYRRSYPWLNVGVLGDDGEIEHTRGVTGVRGLYAVGLRFQHRRKSHFIGGVGEDAHFVAEHIVAGAQAPSVRAIPCGSDAWRPDADAAAA